MKRYLMITGTLTGMMLSLARNIKRKGKVYPSGIMVIDSGCKVKISAKNARTLNRKGI